MFVRDEKTMKFLAVNDAAVNHYGYSKEEILKMTIKDIRPAEDIPILMDILAHQQTGMSKLGTFRHQKKDGEIIDVDVTTHKIIFDGQPARLVLANDITERLKVEKALVQSEEKYRSIVENADEGILLMDKHSHVKFVNPKLAGIVGYERKEIESRTVLDFIFEEDKTDALEFMAKNREGRPEKFEFRLKHRDGSERWVSINAVPVFDENQNYEGGLGFVTDITRQREAEAVLQRTNEMLRALINYSPLGIIILDKDGKTELWNPACERIFGWDSKDVLGRMLPIVPHDKVEEHTGLRKTIMEGNSFTGQEVERRKKDGGKVDISLSASPLYDSDHHPIGISSFLIDITDRKLAEKERERLFKEVTSARNRLKILSSKLISVQEAEKRNISRELHDEIGQMLTAVKIDVQRIRDESESDEINSLADDCKKLVEETISVVRNLSLELRPSIIDDLGLEASLRWYSDKFYQRTGIEVKTEINKLSGVLPPECAISLFRICQEAMTNIAKHSEADYVKVALNQKQNLIHLSVEDNGKGFNLKKALKLAAKGKSLGLLGMQERAELTGGRLEVLSREGSGTLIKATCQV
jgi:PAS domain S-box-containing protein